MSEEIKLQDIGTQRKGRSWLLALLPLVIFLVLAGVFYKQLAAGGASRDLPSALIGRPAPQGVFEPLPGLEKEGVQVPALGPEQFSQLGEGDLAVVNVWASWCGPCRQEHPLLVEMGKSDQFKIFGLNYKDKPANALRFLGQLGNPYDAVGVDPKGKGAIDWGVYGIPETFVVNDKGIIVAKHVGPLTREAVETKIKPLLNQ